MCLVFLNPFHVPSEVNLAKVVFDRLLVCFEKKIKIKQPSKPGTDMLRESLKIKTTLITAKHILR